VSSATAKPVLEEVRQRFREIVEEAGLLDEETDVRAHALSAEEAIGHPSRDDYPILTGKERVVEARVASARGHAFTDAPRHFFGTLGGILDLDLASSSERAVFMATLNATLRHLGMLDATLHCKDDDPERCGAEIARALQLEHRPATVGLIGMNPAIAEHLAQTFGADHLFITDLDPDKVGTSRFGVDIWNGAERTEELVASVDLLLVTGTTLVNGTYERIRDLARTHDTRLVLFGVTAAGASLLAGLERICPFAG
jgi:hypothetical protein